MANYHFYQIKPLILAFFSIYLYVVAIMQHYLGEFFQLFCNKMYIYFNFILKTQNV